MEQLKAKEFEKVCIFSMRHEHALGRATMSRYGVQATFREGQWQPVPSYPDFEGVIRSGRQFVFDCKVCSQASFPLNDDKFEKRQREHMMNRADFGAICFLLIHWNKRELKSKTVEAQTVAFPVKAGHPFWEEFSRGEVKRITRQDSDEYGYPVSWHTPKGARKPRPDILSAIDELISAAQF